MSVRGLQTEGVDRWTGLNTFSDLQQLTIGEFSAALNVFIQANGNVAVLRSPNNWNNALSTSNLVLSTAYYDRQAGGIVFFDITTTGGGVVTTFSTTGTTNTQRRDSQAVARWNSVNVNDRLFRVNGSEFMQYETGLSAYRVGIDKPAAAPIATITSNGAVVLNVGATVSYAYRNSTTGHIGLASSASASSGSTNSSATNQTLSVYVTASTQTGVDGIVLFITADGGSLRYLSIDSGGNPVIYANSTTTIGITSNYTLNLNVQETQFNDPPPTSGNFIFRWKNRLCLCGFTASSIRTQLVYSGFDQISYGVPWEAWPALNIITIPNRGEYLLGGIETAIGALLLTDRNAYLLNGIPTDKIASGVNTIQFSEQLQQLNWGLGTRSPLTIVNTPFGVVWLDQDKHLQLWLGQGMPMEIASNLRSDLLKIQDTDARRADAEAVWYQSGDQAGFYILTASTSGSTNDRMWVVTMARRNGELWIAGVVSDVAAQSIVISRISGTVRCLIGITDRVRQFLANSAGVGWGSSSGPYCEIVAGNTIGFYHRLHAIRFSATTNTIVQVRNADDSEIEALSPDVNDGDFFALVNRYGVRHKLRFVFPSDDADNYQLKNLFLAYGQKRRVV